MGIFDRLNIQQPGQQQQKPTEFTGKLQLDDFWVAGIQYHKNAILAISTENPDFRKTAQELRKYRTGAFTVDRYKYKTEPVVLILEPGNKNDKNAVKVYVHDQHVGYVPRDHSKRIHDILMTAKLEAVEARIDGGEYRVVFEDGKENRGTENVKIHVLMAYRKP